MGITINKIFSKVKFVQPEKFFAITALLFGFIFIVITPPFQTPDEVVHYFRSYQISTLNLTLDDSKIEVPKSLVDTVTETSTMPIIKFDASKKYDGNKTLNAIKKDLDEQNTQPILINLALGTSYGPFAYFPTSVGFFIGRSLDLSPILLLYLGRIANLITWIVLFYAAIKIMPRKKWAVVFIGLLPMGLFQAISLGADSLTVSLGVLFVCAVLYLREQTKITWIQICTVTLIGLCLALTKQNMLILLPFIFLLKKNSFPTKHKSLSRIYMISIPVIFAGLWAIFAPLGTGGGIDLPPSGQDEAAQLSFILNNPHSFINVMWNTYFYTWGDGAVRSLIGTFGWVDTPLSEAIVIIGYLAFFLVTVGNYADISVRKWLSNKDKLLIALLVVGFWLSVNLAMYLYYSPVGFKIITGLQGRYFIPILICLIPMFYGHWLLIQEKVYLRIATLTPLFLLTCSAITIYTRYYINNV